MADISVLNTTAQLSGKTLVTAESDWTLTGLLTFDRDPSAPFAVSASSAKVTNLDADKVDGVDVSTLAANRIPYAQDAATLINSAAFTFDGTLLTIPGQIKFPAAQAASADANTLDDYEEGTWTPVIGGSGGTSGQTYSAQTGRYVKVGRLVMANCFVQLSVKGTITTNVQIQGLPFTSVGTSVFPTAHVNWIDLATTFVSVKAVVLTTATVADVRGAAAANVGSNTALATTDISNTTGFTVTICYEAAS